MNKVEFIAKLAEELKITKTAAEAAVNGFVKVTTDALASGDKVQFVGFGTFEAKERAAHTGRNPSTGEALEIAAKTVPSFKAGEALKAAVNK